jgi:hypothetical protein
MLKYSYVKALIQKHTPVRLSEKLHWNDVHWNFSFEEDRAGASSHILKLDSGCEDLTEIFTSKTTLTVDKWHHYIPIYERNFSRFRGTEVRILEIGVSKGGSLQMWREYFGPKAIIFGIDIDPKCAEIKGLNAEVRIGSQDNEEFLKSVVSEMGGVDIIIDDGSHLMEHVSSSLNILYPILNQNGLYVVEDLHTAYFHKFGGGYHSNKNFFKTIFKLVNDMHSWYHPYRRRLPEISQFVTGIHIHDSIVVLEKNQSLKPVRSEQANI